MGNAADACNAGITFALLMEYCKLCISFNAMMSLLKLTVPFNPAKDSECSVILPLLLEGFDNLIMSVIGWP